MKNYFENEQFNHLLSKAVESAPTWDDALVAAMQLAAEHGYHITKELEKSLRGDWEFEQSLKKLLNPESVRITRNLSSYAGTDTGVTVGTQICRFCRISLPKVPNGVYPHFILDGLCPYHFAMVGYALEALVEDGDAVFSVAPALAAYDKPYAECDKAEKKLHMTTIFIVNAFRGEDEETRKAVEYITDNTDFGVGAIETFLRELRDRLSSMQG